MAHQYSIDIERGFIESAFEGRFDLQQLNDAVAKMYADPSYDPSFNGVCDCRAADFAITTEDLKAHQAFLERHPKVSIGYWAVISDTSRETAFATYYSTLSREVHTVKIFSTDEAAREWLMTFGPIP